MKITRLDNGKVYSTVTNVTAQFQVQVGLTQMPLPLLDLPMIMNFGGAQPQLTLTWTSTDVADVMYLIENFCSAAIVGAGTTIALSNGNQEVMAAYLVDLTNEWGSPYALFPGYVYNIQITQNPGQLVWDVSWTLYVGSLSADYNWHY
ncbi:MAG: hypothetical protein QXU98_11325 [Candidatus Parvarchaeota archaeon]